MIPLVLFDTNLEKFVHHTDASWAQRGKDQPRLKLIQTNKNHNMFLDLKNKAPPEHAALSPP